MILPKAGSRIAAALAAWSLAGLTFTGMAANAGPAIGHASLPLAGKVVGIDPGHNGRNYSDPGYIDHPIWNGREEEACDTTGTETAGGYTEARFNFNVAEYLAEDLRGEGARVVLTRTNNDGVGPCVTQRSEILDRAHANVAIDIHADGGPTDGRGFAVLEPVADGPNDRVISASRALGRLVLERYHDLTGMPVSNYDGTDGISYRDNLAGLNLTTVPKVLIECGNMRNPTDAALLVRPSFQRLAAYALAQAITSYLMSLPTEGWLRMASVLAGITTSIDGYIAGPNDGPGRGLGDNGERLHYWVFGGPWTYAEQERGAPTGEDAAWLTDTVSRIGAVVGGRGTYEAARHWGGESPWGLPFFIVTHSPEEEPPGGAFTFVSGVEAAVERAQQAAAGKDVHVMGGAEIIRQALAARIIDELTIIIAPVVMAAGKRLFDGFSQSLDLEHLGVRQSPHATFIQYRVR